VNAKWKKELANSLRRGEITYFTQCPYCGSTSVQRRRLTNDLQCQDCKTVWIAEWNTERPQEE